MKKKIKIIYIVGCGRSGSTLLERILGEIHGFFSVGEFVHVWKRSFLDNQLCSCGQPFSDCTFWQDVVTENGSVTERQDIDRIQMLLNKTTRTRHVPMLLFEKFRSQKYRIMLEELTTLLGDFYAAVQKQSQEQVIVDSSKSPLYALLLSNIKTIDLHVIHLVRDSRAVAYSRQRQRLRPEIQKQKEFMPRYSVHNSSIEWNKSNYLSILLLKRPIKYYRIRYEDFVYNPVEKLSSILEHFQLNDCKFEELFYNNIVSLRKNSHTVSGNPLRFQTGKISIRLDGEWKKSLSRHDQLVVQMLTFPLNKFLGY